VPSGPYIKPQKLDQFALGYYTKLKGIKFESEVFYKKIKNRLDYIDGADLVANDNIETVILPGISRAYGMELLLRKNLGRHKYWIAYTLSKSEQKTLEEIVMKMELICQSGIIRPMIKHMTLVLIRSIT